MLTADNVHLTYGRTVALAGASATLMPGELLALTGPSGSGKTSLLYCLAGIVRPNDGHVVFNGQRLETLSEDERSDLRRRDCGFVFQFAELVPELTIEENVSLPLELNGVGRRDRRRRVAELLECLGVVELAGRRPAQVSGGQAQRAAVARALVHKPKVVFADEPTGSLDTDNGNIVLHTLLTMAREADTAVVLVTHDPEVAAAADRQIVMQDGRIRAEMEGGQTR